MFLLGVGLAAILLVAGLTAGLWWHLGVEAARKALVATALADLAGAPALFVLSALLPHGNRLPDQDWFGFILALFLFLPGPMLVAELVMFFARRLDMPWKRLLKRLALVLLPFIFPCLFIMALVASAGR